VVKANNQWYLSEAVFDVHGDESGYNVFELTNFGENGEVNKRWALFDPIDLTMPASNTMNFSATDLNNVQEVGIMFSVGRENWAYSFGLIEFTAYAVQKVPDTEAPSTPEGLRATNITQNGCTLHWSPSSDNVGVTGYLIYQVATNGERVLIGSSTSLQFEIDGLAAGQTYQFMVEAVDKAGNHSPLSLPIVGKLQSGMGKTSFSAMPLKIHPNPANGYFMVDVLEPKPNFPITIEVTDLAARTLVRQTVTQPADCILIPTGSLKQGMYLVKIETERSLQVEKLIIENE
jgi:hypothetical protein